MFGRRDQNRKILSVLDKTAENFQFPMLDNGYLYLAATRMSVFGDRSDWAIVFEVFGFSPRAGHPDLSVHTIATSLANRNPRSNFVNDQAYLDYLANNRNYEFKSFFPIENEEWIDREDPELVSSSGQILLRGQAIPIPPIDAYDTAGIELERPQPAIYELCRLLAEGHRELLLASPEERCANIPRTLSHRLTLDDWLHPDLANGQMPSHVPTFAQLASVLDGEDGGELLNSAAGNTHWRNWPEGGLL